MLRESSMVGEHLRKEYVALLTTNWTASHRNLARASRWVRQIGLSIILTGLCSVDVPGQTANEYKVEAAFLYNFAKFVEWSDPGPPNDPISLCIVGGDPFGSILDETVKGKTIGGRPVDIKRVKAGENLQGCQIAFIGSSEKKRVRNILGSLKSASVLTVGETEGFARQGGIIDFTLEDNKVRFEINVDAAKRAGIKISSKLLNLARVLRDEGHEGRS